MANETAFQDRTLFQVKPFTLLKILVTFAVFQQSITCVKAETKQYRNFASKTRYYYEENLQGISQETEKLSEGCLPMYINMVARHGTRHPSKKDVKKINNMLKGINSLFTEKNPFKIGNLTLPWVNPFTDKMDKALTDIGKEELYNISRRIRQRYPELLQSVKSLEQFHFVSTNTQRCLQSAHAFSFGFFEGLGSLGPCKMHPVATETHNVDNDPGLRFFDLCAKYNSKVSENKSSLYEHHGFKHSKDMNKVVEQVRETLGYTDENTITVKHVIGMYIACNFEVAVFDRSNTWCSLFRQEDLLTMEYFYDLKHYWKRGYGYDIAYQIGCVLLKNIVNSIKEAIDSESTERIAGVFQFAHAETLQPLYGVLGLFKDNDTLRADNFDRHQHRKYRTSIISPFGANIAFVVYNCTEESSFKVQILSNERPIALPCCGGDMMCPLEKFLACFDETIQNCSLQKLCQVEDEHQQRLHDDL